MAFGEFPRRWAQEEMVSGLEIATDGVEGTQCGGWMGKGMTTRKATLASGLRHGKSGRHGKERDGERSRLWSPCEESGYLKRAQQLGRPEGEVRRRTGAGSGAGRLA